MLRAGWTSLMARKMRLFMSAFAVILGVAFVSGSFIFTDTLGKAFDGIMTGSVGDVVVRPTGTGGFTSTGTSKTVPARVIGALEKAPGAARVDGNVYNAGTFVISKAGKLIGGQGAPGIAVNYTGGPAANGVEAGTLESGRWPTGPGEVVLDPRTAATSGYLLGETVRFVSTGAFPTLEARLVGTASFGGGSMVGASLSIWQTQEAQRLFLGGKNEFNDIWVAATPGTSQAALQRQVAPLLPAGFEAVQGDVVAKDAATDIQTALSFITTFLLVFAGVALVVGSFLIVNTFSILVAQRARELALFRAIGASRGQVGRSVLLEAAIVGLIGSTVGLALGFVLAVAIRALFGQFGLDLSGAGLAFRPRTAVVAYAVGMIVTLVAAYLPARKAGKVAPVAAMGAEVSINEGSMTRRLAFGGVLAVPGLAAIAAGLASDSLPRPMWWIGIGLGAVLFATVLTSPIVGAPVIRGLGALYRRAFGAVGQMAQENALRNPRRTAATASALMIGVALVAFMAVFGSSAKSSVKQEVDRTFAADYLISNAIGQGFSPAVADEVAGIPGVGTVSRLRWGPGTVNGKDSWIAAVDPATIDKVTTMELTQGSVSDLRPGTVLLSVDRAKDLKVGVGDTLTVELSGSKLPVRVAGLFESNASNPAGTLLTLADFTTAGMPAEDAMVYIDAAPGAGRPALRAALDKAVDALPTVNVKDQADYAAEQMRSINQLLALIYALLGLAVVIAILGIINTLALSVIERTREIGLLRAVGLSRRQVRTMLRLESIVIALLGAVLGIGLGIGGGVVFQRALADEGVTSLTVPWVQLVAFVVLAGVVGVLASVWPGRRAANLDVLRAIATE